MKLVQILVILVSVTFALDATADESIVLSGGMANGRYWLALSPKERVEYVYGFREGISALALIECKGKNYDCFKRKGSEVLPWGIVNGELVECLDQEFSEPTMRVLPIHQLLRHICKARFEGVEPAAIEKARNQLKKNWSSSTSP